jgi:Leucine-rich repeat (LRR) protein
MYDDATGRWQDPSTLYKPLEATLGPACFADLKDVVICGNRVWRSWLLVEDEFRPKHPVCELLAELKSVDTLRGLTVDGSGDPTDHELALVIGNNPSLTWLHLVECQAGGETAYAISQSRQLKVLDLYGNRIFDGELASISNADQLEQLRIGGNPITPDGLAVLRRLRNLRVLILSCSTANDAVLAVLARELPHLAELSMEHCAVTDASVPHLANCRSLEYLNINSTRITMTGRDCLQRMLPGCDIDYAIPTAPPP